MGVKIVGILRRRRKKIRKKKIKIGNWNKTMYFEMDLRRDYKIFLHLNLQWAKIVVKWCVMNELKKNNNFYQRLTMKKKERKKPK